MSSKLEGNFHQDKRLSFGRDTQVSLFVLLKNYKQVKYSVLLTSKFPPLSNVSTTKGTQTSSYSFTQIRNSTVCS